MLLCVPLHANDHALDAWNSSRNQSGTTGWRPQLLLRLLLSLCQFFLALSLLLSSGALLFQALLNGFLLLALRIRPVGESQRGSGTMELVTRPP